MILPLIGFLSGLLLFYSNSQFLFLSLLLLIFILPFCWFKKEIIPVLFIIPGIIAALLAGNPQKHLFDADKGLPEKGFADAELVVTGFPTLLPDGKYQILSGNIKIISDKAGFLYRSQLIHVLGNLQTYHFGNQTFGTLYANEINIIKEGFLPFSLVSKLRAWSNQKIMSVGNKEIESLLFSMILGSTEFVDYSVSQSFRMTGITHLLAISGLNVALVSLAILFILRRFFSQKTSLIVASLVIILYVALAGFGASILRAGIMFLIYQSIKLSGRDPDFVSVVLASMIPVLCLEPASIENAGFYLSYGAVLGITFLTGLFNKIFQKLPKVVSDILSVTLAANIATLPILLFYFKSFSVISPFANLLVIPVFNILTGLLFIRFLISSINFSIPGKILDFIIMPLWKFCEIVADYLSRIQGAYITVPHFPLIAALLMALILIFAIVFIPAGMYRIRMKWIEKSGEKE